MVICNPVTKFRAFFVDLTVNVRNLDAVSRTLYSTIQLLLPGEVIPSISCNGPTVTIGSGAGSIITCRINLPSFFLFGTYDALFLGYSDSAKTQLVISERCPALFTHSI